MKNMYENLDIVDFKDEDDLLDVIIKKSIQMNKMNISSICILAKEYLIDFLLVELVKNEFQIDKINFDEIHELKNQLYYLKIDKNSNIRIGSVCNNSKEIKNLQTDFLYLYEDNITQNVIDKYLNDNIKCILFSMD